METDQRIAEFKFINWTGSDTIRQNNTFIDFLNLVEYETDKKKYLYIIDKSHFLRFLNNKRALKSVLSKNRSAADRFYSKYSDRYSTVSDYYKDKKGCVKIVDLKNYMSEILLD